MQLGALLEKIWEKFKFYEYPLIGKVIYHKNFNDTYIYSYSSIWHSLSLDICFVESMLCIRCFADSSISTSGRV